MDPADAAAEWRQRYQSSGWEIWIAEADGTPVGFVWVLYLPDATFSAGDYYYYYLAVEAAWRGQGLGRKLMQHARQALPGAMRMLVRHDSPAKRLYLSLGARPFREELVWPEKSLGGS
ncbi:MAG: GNAT family N-acetyltransferase [Candidatus Sericytochromatia bacterium]|nr:GNAT family N-acetyltransferase [Candidatus Sericytochromatia bacterium]